MDSNLDPLALPEYLTAPFPAYVSLQSALYFHGMISQIPQVVFVTSLGKTRRVSTSIATYPIHRLVPEFFGGYRTDPNHEVKMATPTSRSSPARSTPLRNTGFRCAPSAVLRHHGPPP